MHQNIFGVLLKLYNFVKVIKMNLEKLKVTELNKQELRKTDGGFFGPFRVGLNLAYRQMWGLRTESKEMLIA